MTFKVCTACCALALFFFSGVVATDPDHPGQAVNPYQPLPSVRKAGTEIRIGIGRVSPEISLTSDADFTLSGDGATSDVGGKDHEFAKETLVTLRATFETPEPGIILSCNGQETQAGAFLIRSRNAGRLRILPSKENGKNLVFRGYLRIRPEKGKTYQGLFVTNTLDLNEYLAGVLSREIPPTFLPEAQKIMVLAARTFALRNRGRHGKEGFDLCSTVHCQVYGGVESETDISRGAVDQCPGEALFFGSTLANIKYHSTCGGITEEASRVWSGASSLPYLHSVPDQSVPFQGDLSTDDALKAFLANGDPAFCKESSRFRWTETYTAEQLTSAFSLSLPVLLKSEVNLGALQSVKVLTRSPGGRVQAVEIKGTGGTYVVEKDAVRRLFSGGRLGTGGLRSTLFYIEEFLENDCLKGAAFHGAGWGHGVGICQFGTNGMVKAGFSYKEIITHYCPGVEVRELQGSILPSGQDLGGNSR